ncbi:hypothetical protein [Kitasatospora sp. McL0602]|uniref:hypothetical protein n=1 Tax=Kitasatospora sp. McL0602 TaxID=3439530 RepID=UPI003F898B6A
MPFDDRFTQILHEAAELSPDPPGAELAAAARQYGRRRAVRRRATMAASAAALVLVGLGAFQLLPAAPRALPTPAGTSLSVPPTPVSGPSPRSSSPTPKALQPVQVNGAFMKQTIVSVLPPGQITELVGFGVGEMSLPTMGPTVALKYDDGHGAGMVNLTTDRVAVPLTVSTQGTQCTDPFDAPVESCQRTVRPDGSVLVIEKLLPRDPTFTKSWTATFTGADGRQVRIDELNSRTAGPPITRPEPPLTAEQLTSVVTSSAWDAVFEVFNPVPTHPPTVPSGSPGAAPAPAAIVDTLGPLLPPGARTESDTSQQTNPGQAHLKVTLNGREGMLLVTVDPMWGQGVSPDPRKSFEENVTAGSTLTHTADGASVITYTTAATKSGGGPAVSWHTEVLHPNGTRVEISEWIGSSGYEFKPGTPVLTPEQLTAVATAAAWRR